MTTLDPRLPLELLNGAGMIVDGIFLAWGVVYLRREATRRYGSTPFWEFVLRTPPHMNFIVAVLVHDAGVWLRSLVIWSWRRFSGGGDFTVAQAGLLAAGALLIVVGGLCKIRAVTKPDYGDAPWLTCLYLLAIFLAGSLVSR